MKTRIKNFFPSLTFSSFHSHLPLSYLLLTFLTLFAASVASAQIPSTGLVGYWPFNGNANDESGNGNNGTVNGATLTTDRFGNLNSAMNFLQFQYVEVPNLHQNNINEYTISAWFNRPTTNTFQDGSVVSGSFPGQSPAGLRLNMGGINRFQWQLEGFPGQNGILQNHPSSFSTNYCDGQWHLVVATFSSANGLVSSSGFKLYVDGSLVQTISNHTNWPTMDTTAFAPINNGLRSTILGNCGGSYFNFSNAFKGILDDISIYNRALTPAEISQLYTDPSTTPPVACTPFLGEDQTVCAGTNVTLSANGSSLACPTLPSTLQNGLVGYWPFCGNANDASGNGNNGTVNGATLTTDRFGNANSAYSFDGVNDIIQFGDLNYVNAGVPGEFTVSIWLNINQLNNDLGGGQCMLFGDEISQNNGTLFQVSTNYGFGSYTAGSSGWYCGCFPNLNNWIYYTVVQDQGGQKLFINGQLWGQLTSLQNSEVSAIVRMGLFDGCSGPCQRPLNGKLDDVSLYNRALSASEIQQLYTLGQSTYLWSTGATTATINVTPTTTTNYTCTVTDANGNVCTDSVTVFVPQIEATDLTICAGETTTLSVSGINSAATPSACQTLPTNLQTGLVGYWPFCGNANDASGNGNNGTVNGATLTTDRFGNANSAYSFLSIEQDFIAAPQIGMMSSSSTYSAWVNFSGQIGGGSPSLWLDWYTIIDPLLLNANPNVNHFQKLIINHNNQPMSATSLPFIEWHHVSVSIGNNGQTTFIIDGVSSGTQFISGGYSLLSASNLFFGKSSNDAWYWNGKLDDIVIHNRVLSSSEIQQLYTLGQTTYLWSNGATTPTINVSPTSTTTYTCTVTTNGVSCTDTVTVVVSNPIIDLGADVTVCGNSTTLTAPSGYDSYLWSNGGTTNTTTVTTNGTYSCTVTQGGCSATDSIDVTLINATVTASDSTICAGEIVTLSVPQAGSTSTACSALPTNLQTGLVGYWPFCGNANDASGNGNNGTVNGATLTTDRFGSANGAYSFDGYNDLIRVPHQPNLNLLGDYSISVWLEGNFQNLFNNNWVLIAKRDDAGTCCSPNVPYDFFIPFNNTNYAVPGMAYANGGYSFATPPNNITVPLAGWQNVIITNSSDNLKFFVNGNLVYTTNFPSSLRLPNTSDLLIGSVNREFGAEWMNGKLDDIGTWSRALSAAEIQQLFSLGQTTYLWSNGATTPTINVSPTTTTTYTCTVTTNGVSCTDDITVVVSQPVASITPNGIVEICQGQSIALTANGGVSYLWNTGAPSQSITVNTEAVYSVTVTDANGCTDTESQLVKVNFLPNIGVNNVSICPGQSTTLTATGGVSYVWSPATGLSSTTGTTVTASPSTSTVYTVTGTGANGCTNTATAAVAVNALPTATIAPATATTFCQGGSVVLNANTGAGLTYQWRLNGTNITGATTSSYTASASGSYTVVVTNTSTCSATSTATVVTVNPLPTATITPATATTFCQGGSVVLNANTGTGLTYQWRLNGTNITGATTSSYTANASGSYTVVVTNTSTCSATSTPTVVTVNALPTATITPATATTFCQGGSVVLNSNTGAGLTYQWRLNGTNITGATSSSYTANASGSYTVVVTNTSTCSATSTATVVTVNALPTATITASSATTFCQGGSVVLNANTGAGLTYQWRLNGNPISGATTSSYAANASGSYTVVVTNTSTCSVTSTPTVVTVNALPVASISPNGLVEICQGQSIALTANGGVTYLWNTGAPTQSITVSTEALYTVTVTDVNGCTDTESQFVKVNLLPNIGVNNASICVGQSATLTATGGLSYLWSPATGLSSTTGTTVSSSTTTNAVYTVTGTGANGCTNSATATVTVNSLPTATITPATATTFCQGGSVVLNANTGTGLSYQWFNNTVAISGSTSSSYTANASGSYTVVVTNTSACSSTSAATVVTVVPNVNYYADVDGDGFGDAATLVSTCVQPQGYVTDNTDCDDTSADVNPAATEVCNHIDDDCSGTIDDGLAFNTYFADLDGDSYGDANNSIYECSQPIGYVTNSNDCNDNNANQSAASTEICNGEDDDCDGAIDNGLIFLDYYADLDSDGFGAGVATNSCVDLGAGYVTNNTDCNDNNANQNTASTEICNGEDDDCDGTIDNGLVFLDFYSDIDGDGFGAGDVTSSCSDLGAGYVTNNTDCDDANSNINSSATETCNTIDDNCDGQIDEGVQTVYFIDNDGDTYGNPSVSILACTQPIGYTPDDTDCNDTDANINPGAEDIGGNGIDENCDGEIDNSIFELNATISLYPNPTRSELNIQVNSSIIGNDLFIFDAVGKLVYKQQLLSTQTILPVSNFADGNYVVRIGEVVKRFVVEK